MPAVCPLRAEKATVPFLDSWMYECSIRMKKKRIFVCRHYSSRGRAGGGGNVDFRGGGRFKQKHFLNKTQCFSSAANALACLVLCFFSFLFCGKSRTAPSAQKCHFDFVQYSTWIILALASFSSPKRCFLLLRPPTHTQEKKKHFLLPTQRFDRHASQANRKAIYLNFF